MHTNKQQCVQSAERDAERANLQRGAVLGAKFCRAKDKRDAIKPAALHSLE